MNYKKIYEDLIKKCKERKIERFKQGYEIHHIIPRSFGGGDLETNLVMFTLREHFLAHRLLTKFTTGFEKYKMCCAMNIMSGCEKYKSSRAYNESLNINLPYFKYWNGNPAEYKLLHINLSKAVHEVRGYREISMHDADVISAMFDKNVVEHPLYMNKAGNLARVGKARFMKKALLQIMAFILSSEDSSAEGIVLENIPDRGEYLRLGIDILVSIDVLRQLEIPSVSGVRYAYLNKNIPNLLLRYPINFNWSKTKLNVILRKHNNLQVQPHGGEGNHRVIPRFFKDTTFKGNSVFEENLFKVGKAKHIKECILNINEELDKLQKER